MTYPIPKDVLQARIQKSVYIDSTGCWIWQQSLKNGYGQMSIMDKSEYVHRVSYFAFVGNIPNELWVLHECDVRKCCNPKHLFLGTYIDNINDMRAKNRGVDPPAIRGETHPKAHNDDSCVIAVRLDTVSTQRELARKFDVSQSTIWRWKNSVTRGIQS